MRDRLRKTDWHVHGLKFSDIQYIFALTKEIIEMRNAATKESIETRRIDKLHKPAPDETWVATIEEIKNMMQKRGYHIVTDPFDEPEFVADLLYYQNLENHYLWEFCLWRAQGIFEGIIVNNYLKTKKRLPGLKAKLNEMEKAGWRLSSEIKDDLAEWSELRNALSHMPPEAYRPAFIQESDVEEYVLLVKRSLDIWGEAE